MIKGKREKYETITFTPTSEMRKRILDMAKETGHPASAIVLKCVEYALKKAKLKPIKKDIFFE